MSETKEIIEFGDIKDAEIYLQRVEKDIHKKSFSDQIAFREEIKKRHDKKQIQMLLGRLEDMIDNKKALSHFTTAFFAILSFILGGTLNYGLGLAEVSFASTIIILVFYTAVAIWFALSFGESRRLKKLTGYKRLLQECLEEIPDKRHFRRRV
ncbi:hypothetical protein [Bacillus spizizenii]|uniref:Uncharacterized protein n=1 Tax=Bacillus spizizenii (strain DSM 15029 / JCM 12233 / NBRC 101239 / NRRL B-23049 / TU-B-10) TaxID=1052585 RepID=G4NTH3_BACS4|nr:hypothetical protein [Bacillus spizizenii]AEP84959.1 hypothetical protein GYO_0218 [Bacillus spizizenii TU-B-10]AEP85028.1 hypothetical protein GYO_0297 [Bacillus spizizenii TU-B-10]GEK27420.1 hypothetical protein BSU04nite_38090 [Bacillus spizizenii]